MKVLIEVDESKLQEVAGALKKPEIGAKILGTGKNMTLDTVFAAEDVWTLIVDPCHEASFASDHFDDVQLLNIESYGRNEYLETVINWLNHHFDANEGLNWQLVFSAAKHIYNALNLEKEAYAVIDHVSVDGLRTALRRYDDNGERGECGSWEIHSSGYDRWWEISHDGQVLVACYASGEHEKIAGKLTELGNIERERHLADKTFTNICKIVGEEFPECRMAPREQMKIADKNQSLGR